MASDEAALHKFLKADMEAVLRTLSEKEAGVVRLRFGLVDGTEKTLEECGKYFGVSGAGGSSGASAVLWCCCGAWTC